MLIVTKKERSESNTNYAQGGIASVVGGEDSLEAHVRDTLVAGAGLCHEDAVRVLVHEGPERVRDHFPGAVEDAQVREIRMHDAFVHRARQLELLERVLAAGLERNAVREVMRLFGGGEGGDEEQGRDQRFHRASRGDRGGTGEK